MSESLSHKVAVLKLYQKRLQRKCFPVNIVKFLRTPVLKNICELLLLFFLVTNLIGKVTNGGGVNSSLLQNLVYR